jgi:hypothetical protein
MLNVSPLSLAQMITHTTSAHVLCKLLNLSGLEMGSPTLNTNVERTHSLWNSMIERAHLGVSAHTGLRGSHMTMTHVLHWNDTNLIHLPVAM